MRHDPNIKLEFVINIVTFSISIHVYVYLLCIKLTIHRVNLFFVGGVVQRSFCLFTLFTYQ